MDGPAHLCHPGRGPLRDVRRRDATHTARLRPAIKLSGTIASSPPWHVIAPDDSVSAPASAAVVTICPPPEETGDQQAGGEDEHAEAEAGSVDGERPDPDTGHHRAEQEEHEGTRSCCLRHAEAHPQTVIPTPNIVNPIGPPALADRMVPPIDRAHCAMACCCLGVGRGPRAAK